MSNRPGLRDRKKEATRQAISDVATRLFVERGFDKVSVADVAREADVAWTPGGMLVMAEKDVLYGWKRGDAAWRRLADLAAIASAAKSEANHPCRTDM